MRKAILAIGLAAACGGNGGGGGGGDGGGGDGGVRPDGPPPGTPLGQRLTVTTVTAPGGVMAGDSSFRIWGQGSLRIAPVYVTPNSECGTLIGYTTGTTTPTAHVAYLGVDDNYMTTFDLGPYELRGLASEDGGYFAALLWDTTTNPKSLHVTRFDSAGANPRVSQLADALAAPTDFGIGESRLEYGGGKYAAYYHVHGISGFANGHEGDQYKLVDAASGAVSNVWSWGCSHSMSEALRWENSSSKFLSACVTDCYPGTSGTNFATDSIGGVYIDNSKRVMNVDGGCNGSVAGEIGSLAPVATGSKLVFNAHQAPAAMGQGSYNAQTMNQDIGLATIGPNGAPVGGVTWLTTTPGNEQNSTIASWAPDTQTQEQYVIGWTEGTSTRAYKIGRFGPDGSVLEAPIDITATAKWGERDDPFRTHRNGDIVWAWFDAPGSTTLHLARISAGRLSPCLKI